VTVRFLVTGGTGFVGGWVARTAAASGHEVIVLARDPEGPAATMLAAAGIDVRGADLNDGPALDAALDAVDVVVHAAATYSLARAAEPGMLRETPALSRSVLEAAGRAGTPHVIDISSAIIFKPHESGTRVGTTDIDSPRWGPSDLAWDDPYLASKVLAGQETGKARGLGLSVSSVHPVLVTGPEDRGPGTSGGLLLSLLDDRALPDVTAGWCDVRDVADAVLAVAGRPPGQRYLIAAETLSFRVVCRTLERLTGRRKRRFFMPRALVKAVARLNDLTGGSLDASIPTRASLEYLLTTRGRIDGSSGLPALGLSYRPFETTVSDTLEWWARNGMLDPALVGRAGARS